MGEENEEKKVEDQEQQGQPSGGNEDNSSGQDDHVKNLNKALQKERGTRREKTKENERLRREVERLKKAQQSGGNGSGDDEEPDDLSITDDDLQDADTLEKKIQRREERIAENVKQGAGNGESEESPNPIDAVYDVLGNYEVFNQDDMPDLRDDAENDLIEKATQELTGNFTQEDVDNLVSRVAKKWDKYRANRSQNENPSGEDNKEEGPAEPGGGSAEASHLQPDEKPAQNISDASKRAKKRFSGLLSKNK